MNEVGSVFWVSAVPGSDFSFSRGRQVQGPEGG